MMKMEELSKHISDGIHGEKDGDNKKRKEIEKKLRFLAQKHVAKSHLLRIPELIRKAVKKGKHDVCLLTFTSDDINRPEGAFETVCYPEWLKGIPKIVFLKCKKLDLSPDVAFCGESDKDKTCIFGIVLHW